MSDGKKLLGEMDEKPSAPKGLGVYQNPLWPRVGDDTGLNGTRMPGPLVSPIKMPDCGGPPRTPADMAQDTFCIKQMMEINQYMMSMILDLMGPAFMPKYGIPLNPTPLDAVVLATSGQGGTWTTLQTITTDAGYEGYITAVQVEAIPSTAWSEVQFRIQLNNMSTPKFDNNSFLPQQMNQYMPVQIYIPPRTTVRLQAINTGASPLLGQGQLKGWTNPIRRT